ncbi:hypothetical protein L5515_004888 [Caenorhabditis briggsae]|uniref:Uncharacterized protein n=1 Tax=Caenorhabditis briggsae TaxID=6238 RepID=A0AAE9ELZ3_CAEBR|nr:hypothetical protein L5515_004888 [Caenorhabditis briggsae]
MTSITPFFVFLLIVSSHVNCHLIPPKISISEAGRNSPPNQLTEHLISCGFSFCNPENCKKQEISEGKFQMECQR